MNNRPTEVFRTRAFLNRLKIELAKNPACTMSVDRLRPQSMLFERLVGGSRDGIERAWAGRMKRGPHRSTMSKYEEVVGAEAFAAVRRPGSEKDLLDAFDLAYSLVALSPLPLSYQDVLLRRKDIYERWAPHACMVGDTGRSLLSRLYEPNYHLRMLHYMYFVVRWIRGEESLKEWCRDTAILTIVEWGRAERDIWERGARGETTGSDVHGFYGDAHTRKALLHALSVLFFREWRDDGPAAVGHLANLYASVCQPRADAGGLQGLLATGDGGRSKLWISNEHHPAIGRALLKARQVFRAQLSEFGMTPDDADSLLNSAWAAHNRPTNRMGLAGQLWDREVSIV